LKTSHPEAAQPGDLPGRGSPGHVLRLAVISAVARTPAFLIPILIAAVFGAGRRTDAYFLAYSLVLFLGGTLAQGLMQAVVPFAAVAFRHGAATARTYLDRGCRASVLAGTVLWVLGLAAFALVSQSELRRDATLYAVAFTPLALAWCAASIFAGALIAEWKIGTSTGSMLWRGVGAVLGVALVPLGAGLWGVAVGLGAGEVLRALWLRRRTWVAISERPDLAPSESAVALPLRDLLLASGAQFLASASIAVAPVVERLLAARLGVGSISRLEYATRLLVVPMVLFDGALVPLALARWTYQITAEGRAPTRREVLRVAGKGFLVAAAIGVVLALLSSQFVHILLARGRFTPDDETSVSRILQLLSISFVGNMTAQLVERHYIALTRNRILAVLNIGRTVIRITVAWSLLGSFGLSAFPIGFAVSDWLYLAVLAALLEARPGAAGNVFAQDLRA